MKKVFVFIATLALFALAGCHNIFESSSSSSYETKPATMQRGSMPNSSHHRRSVRHAPQSGGSEASTQSSHNPAPNNGNNGHAQVGKTTCYAHNGEPGGGVWRSTSHDQGTARGHAMQKCKAGSRTPSGCSITRCVRS